jgi:hypothetical protein
VKRFSYLWAVPLRRFFLALSILIALPPGYAFATKGMVQVAFTSTASPTNSTELFQSMVLNVIGVRLNPTAGSVSETDKKWQLIPAPGGVSGTNMTGQGRTELAVDLASTQGVAQILNTVKIPPKTYAHIELVLDPQNPGNFVPLCGNAQPRGEGCISYPAKLANPNTPIQVQGTVSFVVPTPTTSLPPTIPLVLNIDPGIAGTPTSSADSVTIDPVITVVPNTTFSGGLGNPAMALVSGKVTNPGVKQMVTAQVPGTATIVGSVVVQTKGDYALNLPAAAGGTAYDLIASGKGRAFAVKSNVTVFPGVQLAGTDFSPEKRGEVQIVGKVFDACTGLGLLGVGLEALLPDPAISPAPDCSAGTPVPAGCVVVATAQTDNGGSYPLKSSTVAVSGVPEFQQIPSGVPYIVRVTNPGYNIGNIAVNVVSGALRCNKSGFKNGACNINLEHGEIDAVVSLDAVNTGPALNAMVMAEQSGTNNLVGVATAAIPTGASQSAPVPVFVPDDSATTNPMTALDFFAAVQDSFGTPGTGSPQKATGHSIPVLAAVPGSPKCPEQNNVTPAQITVGNATCVGHGSVEGTVATPDSNTLVILSSNGVQLMQTSVPTGTGTPGEFSFCAPADTTAAYTLNHVENQLDGTTTPVSSVPVTMAAPVTIAAPCSGICGNTGTTCLLCTGVSGVSLP